MSGDDEQVKSIGNGLAIMGISSVFFACLLVWDLFELATLGEVIVRGRLRGVIGSGATLLWFHGALFAFSTLILWRYYRDYKEYANEVRTHNK
jgi:hypothetical protein